MIKASDVRLAPTASIPVESTEILEILSVADFKTEHRILHSAEDGKVEECIKQAFFRLDGPSGYLNRAILEQTWVAVVDRFDEIEIPLPIFSSLGQFRYRDENGDWQVLSSTVFGIDTYHLFARIFLKSEQSWPAVHSEPGSIELTFTAGWESGAKVLEHAYNIRKALKLLGGHYFANPTPTFVEPRLVEVPRKVQYQLEHVLGQFRIVNDHS